MESLYVIMNALGVSSFPRVLACTGSELNAQVCISPTSARQILMKQFEFMSAVCVCDHSQPFSAERLASLPWSQKTADPGLSRASTSPTSQS